MDGNKDDALKCLKLGKEALEAGNRTRALKFVNKARRLDPTLPVEDLLSAIKSASGDELGADSCESGDTSFGTSSSKPSDQPSLRRRVPASESSESSASATYTEEQIEVVRQIKKKKDYYEILGLEKSCSTEDVRKSYRKLSLKVHPDKNNAPGAEEAFKAVSKAFQCLSNEESRKNYDLVGSDEPVYERRTRRHGANGFNGFYEADVDAEEIFRNFFFGGMAPTTTHFRTFNFGPGMAQRTGDQGSGGGLRTLIQLLPVLLILLLNFLPSSEPIYALSHSYPYEYQFTTQKGVNYYVKSTTFEDKFPPNSPDRMALERQVERDYFNILAQNCRVEMQRRQWGLIRETTYCDMLRKFESAA
ncbi:chaperone protein dnaJ 49-like [Momordica charantia]|uniref:Chaperone protein dnaJ 49-like n=1 Tax=Momordica charantia TaxID=3673 RepID=A0A6J1CV49_MOMCH|nr:chaperone protein dnaJ 49-like [Momordica charantia]XP_022145022.1 chaperone protein dnaJ 49-like [Momordica charantia]